MRNRSAGVSANVPVFAFITLVTVLLVFAVFYAFHQNKTISASAPEATFLEQSAREVELRALANEIYEKDTDGDGLMDWEEILWETDKNDADTDGDGINDKDDVYGAKKEAILAFDVTRADAFSGEAITFSENGIEATESDDTMSKVLNATDATARELFGSYMLSMQEGSITLSPNEQEQMVMEALSSSEPFRSPPTYDPNRATVVPSTEESRKMYCEDVVRNIYALVADGNVTETGALFIMAQASQYDGEEYKELYNNAKIILDKTLTQYKEGAEVLATMRVPSDALSLHTELVQNLYSYMYNIEGLSMIYEDPMRTASAIKMQPTAFSRLNNTYTKLTAYITKYGSDVIDISN